MKTRALRMAVPFLFALASWASAAPAFEKVVPDDALAFITARNIPALQAKIKEHSLYAIWKEPDVQRFLAKPLQRLTEEIKKGEGKSGVKFDEISSLFHGQVAIVVTFEPNADTPEVVLLVDVGTDGERAMKLMALLEEATSKGPDGPKETPVEEIHEGVKLIHMRPVDGHDDEHQDTYGVAGDVFLLGFGQTAVKRTITFLKAPPAASLAAAPNYQAVLQKVSPDSDVIAFVNIARIVEIAKKKSQDPKTPQIFQALGLNGLACAGAGLAISKDFYGSRIFVQTPGEKEGIVKILTPAPGALHTGAEAPPDASDFLSVRFDPAAIFDSVEKALATAAPEVLAGFNAQMAQMAQQLGQPFSLRNDILAVFGPRFCFYRRFEKPYNLATSDQSIFLVDITSKAAFNGALDKLNKIAPQVLAMFQPQEYLGQQVYVLTPPNGAGMPEGTPRPAFVATERELIISPRLEALQAHLRRVSANGPTLKDRPEFMEALKDLPADGRMLVTFQDPTRQIEFFITTLREGGWAPILNMLRGQGEVAEILDLFDFTLLPDPAVISKHLAPSASCGIVQRDGLLFIGRSKAKPATTPAK